MHDVDRPQTNTYHAIESIGVRGKVKEAACFANLSQKFLIFLLKLKLKTKSKEHLFSQGVTLQKNIRGPLNHAQEDVIMNCSPEMVINEKKKKLSLAS